MNIAGRPLSYNVLFIMSISCLFFPVIPLATNSLHASSSFLVASKSGAMIFCANFS